MTDSNSALTPTHQVGSGMTFGQANLRPQDIVFPRIKIVQLMSAEATDGSSEAGSFFNTLTLEDMGPALRVAPIQTVMQRIFMVRDEKRPAANALLEGAGLPVLQGTRDGLSCRSFDMYQGIGEPGVLCETDCPLSKWTGERTPPMCSEAYNIVAVTELGELVILSFTRTGAKAARRWFSMIRMSSGQGAPWSRMYEVTTKKNTGGKGTFWSPEVRKLPDPTPTEVMRAAIEYARGIQGVQIDVTPIAEDDADHVDDTGKLTGEAPAF